VTPAGLQRECDVFTRFIARAAAPPYVVSKYIEAHRASDAFLPVNRFDAWLVAVASRSPRLTRLADGYARVFEPRGALRKKLVLLLALLESSAPLHRVIDRAPAWPPAIVMLQLAAIGLGGALATMAGTVMFTVIRVIAGIAARRS
jgi:hypothetical protein